MDSDEPDLSSFVDTFNPVGPRVVIDDSDSELDYTTRSDLLLKASVIDTATVQRRRAKHCLVCASSNCATRKIRTSYHVKTTVLRASTEDVRSRRSFQGVRIRPNVVQTA